MLNRCGIHCLVHSQPVPHQFCDPTRQSHSELRQHSVAGGCAGYHEAFSATDPFCTEALRFSACRLRLLCSILASCSSRSDLDSLGVQRDRRVPTVRELLPGQARSRPIPHSSRSSAARECLLTQAFIVPLSLKVLITGIVNGVPDNRPNPLTLFDAGTLSEAIDMLCSSMTYWGQASYGPDDRYMYFGQVRRLQQTPHPASFSPAAQTFSSHADDSPPTSSPPSPAQSSLRVRALVVQIDPLNQCDWGTEVTYPPLCFSDDPAAVAEFSNSSRWVRVEGEAAAPRPSLVRWWYPTGESAGTLHEGFKAGVTPKPDLHFPLLLDEFDRGEFQARIDLLRSKADLVAAYSKFVQLFVVTEHVLTGEARAAIPPPPSPGRPVAVTARHFTDPFRSPALLRTPARSRTSASPSIGASPRWTAACSSRPPPRASSSGTAPAPSSRGPTARASPPARSASRSPSTSPATSSCSSSSGTS